MLISGVRQKLLSIKISEEEHNKLCDLLNLNEKNHLIISCIPYHRMSIYSCAGEFFDDSFIPIEFLEFLGNIIEKNSIDYLEFTYHGNEKYNWYGYFRITKEGKLIHPRLIWENECEENN
jgi:hypothetical protein